jgi:hypothetical protein
VVAVLQVIVGACPLTANDSPMFGGVVDVEPQVALEANSTVTLSCMLHDAESDTKFEKPHPAVAAGTSVAPST